MPSSAATGVYVAESALAMAVKGPDCASDRDHCHVCDDTAPSGSASVAVSTAPTCAVPLIDTAPASLALVTVTVSVSESSIAGVDSVPPEASSLSVT